MKTTFSARQRCTLAALVMAYSSAYICRTNIAMMLPGIMADMRLTQAVAGTMTTLFAIIYAAGQVVNGLIVDRVNPRLWIFAGLTLSALCNLLCAFAPGFAALAALWSINAAAQSMLWTPVVRIVAHDYNERQRPRASFFLSFSLIFGNLAAWGVAGLLVANASWRAAFACCAAITFAVALTTFFMLRGVRWEAPAFAQGKAEKAASGGLARLVWGTGLLMLLFGCVFNGFVRDSIMTWAPTILMETQGIDLDSILGVALIIPCVNLFGVMLGRICYHRLGRQARRAIALLMGFCAVTSLALGLFGQISALLCAALLAACVAAAYGVNPLLTTLLPLEYVWLDRVGAVTGLVDAFIYLGSGLSGVLTGALAEHAGWQVVFFIWAGGALIGTAAIAVAALPRFMSRLREDGPRED